METGRSFDELCAEAETLLAQGKEAPGLEGAERWRRAKVIGDLALRQAKGFEQRRRALEIQKQAARNLGDEAEVKRLQKLLVQVATEQSMFQAEAEAKRKHTITGPGKELP